MPGLATVTRPAPSCRRMHELRALRSPSIIGTLKRYWSIPLPFAGNGECIASSASLE
jgi:hypothetical protein